MIPRGDLRKLAKARLKDAEALYKARRYDGAAYLGGYVVELSLKARICRTLKWPEFPDTNREFQNLKSLKTHDFDTLLKFTGREAVIRTTNMREWSAVQIWSPAYRYRAVGTVSRADARDMLDAAKTLYEKLA